MSLKRKYIKQAYIEEAYCDKCGSILQPTGMALMSYPVQYPYQCSNPECDFTQTFIGDDKPGTLKFEYIEEPPEIYLYRGDPKDIGAALKEMSDRLKENDNV